MLPSNSPSRRTSVRTSESVFVSDVHPSLVSLQRRRNMTHIAVVGAGIAGLNAALTLQDAGLSCTIYEASHRIGGRMHSDAMTLADGMVSGSSSRALWKAQPERARGLLGRLCRMWQ